MNDEIFKFLDVPTLEYVALEDYAYSATGKIFNIAEGCGFLKISLYHSGKKIRLQSPNSIKLWATGYGNCDKIRMEQSYDIRKDAFDLSFLPRVVDKKSNNPKDNIVDAFFICDLLRHELMLRKGLIKLSDLTEKQIQVFNSVSKTFPENILCRDFLEKKI
jgi:Holliday junction resolvasome RuvABC endonuclease subunit